MLFKVTVNGQSHIVDAATKASAKSYGASKLEVTVENASAADLQGIDLNAVDVVRPKPKAEAAAPTETAAA